MQFVMYTGKLHIYQQYIHFLLRTISIYLNMHFL